MDLRKTTLHFILDTYINNIFTKQPNFIFDMRKNSLFYAPSEIDNVLEELGWEKIDFNSNGWQQDTWYWYMHPDYDFQLTMEYGGFYGDLKLYRKDCEDY